MKCCASLHAPVAQLDRVLGYEPRGQEFESLRAHQTNKRLAYASLLSFLALLLPRNELAYQAAFKHPTFHLTFPR
jgi:hypothetical protein